MTTLQSGQVGGGVWISISELASRKKVTRQSATERVNRLVREGLIETRSEGRKRLVELASYDKAVGEAGDAYREQGAETRRDEQKTTSVSPALRDAQTERAQYEARLKQLELAEKLGQVVPVSGPHGVEQAMVRAGEAIVRAIEQLPMQRLAEIEQAAKQDTTQLRRVIRTLCRDIRQSVADAMQLLAETGAAEEAAGSYETNLTEEP